jgi:hypothetical protein
VKGLEARERQLPLGHVRQRVDVAAARIWGETVPVRAVVLGVGRVEPKPTVLEFVGEGVVTELAVGDRAQVEEREAREHQHAVEAAGSPSNDLGWISVVLPASAIRATVVELVITIAARRIRSPTCPSDCGIATSDVSAGDGACRVPRVEERRRADLEELSGSVLAGRNDGQTRLRADRSWREDQTREHRNEADKSPQHERHPSSPLKEGQAKSRRGDLDAARTAQVRRHPESDDRPSALLDLWATAAISTKQGCLGYCCSARRSGSGSDQTWRGDEPAVRRHG